MKLRRFLSMLLAFAMVFGMLPVSAFAAETETETEQETVLGETAETAIPLALDTTVETEMTSGETVYYSFTPETSGDYIFCWPDDEVYWEFGGLPENTQYSNDGEIIYCKLTAGETYVVCAAYWSSEPVMSQITVSKAPAVEELYFDIEEISSAESNDYWISGSYSPVWADTSTITWSVSDESVVKVVSTYAEAGRIGATVKFVGGGTASISVDAGNGIGVTFPVTVEDLPNLVYDAASENALSWGQWTLVDFTAPADGWYWVNMSEVDWIDVNSVDGSGVYDTSIEYAYNGADGRVFRLTGGAAYQFRVNATWQYDSEPGTKPLNITALEKPESFALNRSEVATCVNTTVWLAPSFLPEGTMDDVTWSFDNEEIVSGCWTDGAYYCIRVRNAGTVTVTATTSEGLTASCVITVQEEAPSGTLVLDETLELMMEQDSAATLYFTPVLSGQYLLHKAQNGNVGFYMSDSTVEETAIDYGSIGKVYTLEGGRQYTIQAYRYDGNTTGLPVGFTVTKIPVLDPNVIYTVPLEAYGGALYHFTPAETGLYGICRGEGSVDVYVADAAGVSLNAMFGDRLNYWYQLDAGVCYTLQLSSFAGAQTDLDLWVEAPRYLTQDVDEYVAIGYSGIAVRGFVPEADGWYYVQTSGDGYIADEGGIQVDSANGLCWLTGGNTYYAVVHNYFGEEQTWAVTVKTPAALALGQSVTVELDSNENCIYAFTVEASGKYQVSCNGDMGYAIYTEDGTYVGSTVLCVHELTAGTQYYLNIANHSGDTATATVQVAQPQTLEQGGNQVPGMSTDYNTMCYFTPETDGMYQVSVDNDGYVVGVMNEAGEWIPGVFTNCYSLLADQRYSIVVGSNSEQIQTYTVTVEVPTEIGQNEVISASLGYNSSMLLSFTPETSGYYLPDVWYSTYYDGNNVSVQVCTWDGSWLDNVNGLGIYYLEAGVQYVLQLQNNTGYDPAEYSFTVRTPAEMTISEAVDISMEIGEEKLFLITAPATDEYSLWTNAESGTAINVTTADGEGVYSNGEHRVFSLVEGQQYLISYHNWTEMQCSCTIGINPPVEIAADVPTALTVRYNEKVLLRLPAGLEGLYTVRVTAEHWGWSFRDSQGNWVESDNGAYELKAEETYTVYLTNYSQTNDQMTVTVSPVPTAAIDEVLEVKLPYNDSRAFFVTPETTGYYILSVAGGYFGCNVYDPDGRWMPDNSYVYQLEGGMRYRVEIGNWNYENAVTVQAVMRSAVTMEADTDYTQTYQYNERRLYSFTPETSGFYNFMLTGAFGYTLTEASGSYVNSSASDEWNGGVNIRYLTAYLEAGTQYLLRINSWSEGETEATLQVCTAKTPDSVYLSWSDNTIFTGGGMEVHLHFDPSSAAEAYTWSVSNPEAAQISEINYGGGSCYVTGLAAGTVEITATTASGKSASVTVTVKDPIALEQDEVWTGEMVQGQSEQFAFTPAESGYYVLVADDNDADIGFKTADGGYVSGTRKSYGTVRAVYGYLEAGIEYRGYVNPYNSRQMTVYISKCTEPESISLNAQSITTVPGGQISLLVEFPRVTDYADCVWSQDVEGVLRPGFVPNQEAYYTAYETGTATLTVSAETSAGTIQTQCVITVNENKAVSLGHSEEVTLNPQDTLGYAFTVEYSGYYRVAVGEGVGMYAYFDDNYSDVVFMEQDGVRYGFTYLESGGGEIWLYNNQKEACSFTMSIEKAPEPESITLNMTEVQTMPGNYLGLCVQFAPFGSYIGGTWEWSGDDILYPEYGLMSNMTFYIHGQGTAAIRFVAENGMVASCTVNSGVTGTPIEEDVSTQLSMEPWTDNYVTFTPSESGYYVLTVDAENIHAYSTSSASSCRVVGGKTYCYFQAEAGDPIQLCVYSEYHEARSVSVTVQKADTPTGMELSRYAFTLPMFRNAGSSLWAYFTPDTAVDEVIWTVEDPTVAYIMSENINEVFLVGLKEGTTTVTATWGEVSQTCTVTVKEPEVLTVDSTTAFSMEAGGVSYYSFTPEAEGWYVVQTGSEPVWLEIMAQADLREQEGQRYWFFYATAGNTVNMYLYNEAGAQVTGELTLTAATVPTSITVDESMSVTLGSEFGINAWFDSPTAMGNMQWTVEDNGVLEYMGSGLAFGVFRAVGTGTATVTATCGELTAICTVTVTAGIPLNLDETRDFVLEGNSASIGYTFTTDSAGYYALTVSADNMHLETSAEFNTLWQDGKTYFIAYLEAGRTYNFNLSNGNNSTVEATIVISHAVEPTGMTLSRTQAKAILGEGLELTAIFDPITAMGDVSWSVENEDILFLEYAGVGHAYFAAKALGTTTVTATWGDVSVTCTVTVREPVAMTSGDTVQLDMLPGDFEYGSFSVDNDGYYVMIIDAPDLTVIPYVDGSGAQEVDGIIYYSMYLLAGEGYTLYLANDTQEQHTGTITLREADEPAGITLSQQTMNAIPGISMGINVLFTPVTAAGDVSWSSSDPAVVSIGYSGFGYATLEIGEYGEAVITATCGAYTASCTVIVAEPEAVTTDTDYSYTLDTDAISFVSFTPEETGEYTFCLDSTVETGMLVMTETQEEYTEFFFSGADQFTRPLTAGTTYIIGLLAMEEAQTMSCSMQIKLTQSELTWSIDDAGVLYINGAGAMDDYDVTVADWYYHSESVNKIVIGEGITHIGNWAFMQMTNVTEVSLPSTLETIGEYAFNYCQSLTQITLPDHMISIGAHAFEGCVALETVACGESLGSIGEAAFNGCTGLKEISLSQNLETIGSRAFYNCQSLTKAALPDSLENIGQDAFANCSSLAEIAIGAKVTSIGAGAFSGCSGLATITVDESNTVYSSIENVVFDKAQTQLILCAAGKEGSFTVPETVVEISESAFENCTKLTQVTLPEGLLAIGPMAFSGCTGMTEITIPASVIYIESGAFAGSFENICVAEGNTSYVSVDGVLFSASMENLMAFPALRSGEYTIPDGVTFICRYAFSYTESLTKVTVPEGVTHLADHAFASSGVQEVVLPATLKVIDDHAFGYCGSLTAINLPEGLEVIGGNAFIACRTLTSIYIPGTVNTWGLLAFTGCGLTEVTLGYGLTDIGSGTFSGCTYLEKVHIPNTVTGFSGESEEGYRFDPFSMCGLKTESGTFTVYAHAGSAAEAYAAEAGAGFVATGHTYVDGSCIYCAKTEVTLDGTGVLGYTLKLDGSIVLNFYVQMSEEFMRGDGTVEVSGYIPQTGEYGVIWGVEAFEYLGAEPVYVNGVPCYKIPAVVAAKEMTQSYSVTLSCGEESKTWSYSVREYAEHVLSNDSYAEVHDLIKTMLNYGAAAQQHFGYATDNLANAGYEMETAVTIPAYEVSAAGTGIEGVAEFVGSSLTLEAAVNMRLYFNVAEGAEVTFTYGDQTLSYVAVADSDAYTGYVEIPWIVAKDLDTEFTVTVTGGEKVADVTYNPMAYCYQVQNGDYEDSLKVLAAALYLYNQAANAYFE